MPKKKSSIKTAIRVVKYSSKKTNLKKFSISKYLKDGTFIRYGVTRTGHRFYEKTYSINQDTKKGKKQIEKIFKEAQKEADYRKVDSLTISTFLYTGRYIKKKNLVIGERTKSVSHLVGKVASKKVGKKRIIFANDVQEIYNDIEINKEEHFYSQIAKGKK